MTRTVALSMYFFALLSQALAKNIEQGNQLAALHRPRIQRATPDSPGIMTELDIQLEASLAPEMAQEIVKNHLAELKIELRNTELKLVSSFDSPAQSYFRFQQFYDGLPIEGGTLTVAVSKAGKITFALNRITQFVAPKRPKTLQSKREASATALSALGINRSSSLLPYLEKAQTVFAKIDGRLVHALKSQIVPRFGAGGQWDVFTSLETGEVLEVQRASPSHLQVEASTIVSHFNPAPNVLLRKTYGETGIEDSEDADSSQLTSAVRRTAIQRTVSNGRYYFENKWAKIVDSESPFEGEFSDESIDHIATRTDQSFEAGTVFFNITESMRYINDDLGFKLKPYQYEGGVRADPQGLAGDDNSHYTPLTGELAFGEGGVDDAEDPDVVLHELGHAIHDWATNGNLSQIEGLSEGSGDYWAATARRALGISRAGEADFDFVFAWDGHNPFWRGRITNYRARYPSGLTGTIHTDGQIWSSTLMEIWMVLGRKKTDRLFLEALCHLDRNSNQQDAANAFVSADKALNRGVNVELITRIFKNRGYKIER